MKYIKFWAFDTKWLTIFDIVLTPFWETFLWQKQLFDPIVLIPFIVPKFTVVAKHIRDAPLDFQGGGRKLCQGVIFFVTQRGWIFFFFFCREGDFFFLKISTKISPWRQGWIFFAPWGDIFSSSWQGDFFSRNFLLLTPRKSKGYSLTRLKVAPNMAYPISLNENLP